MIFFIHYYPHFDDNTFKIWLNHYSYTGLKFNIVVSDADLTTFSSNYPYSISKIISEKPIDCLELTINDFLFTYDRDDNDNIVLNYNFDLNFIKKSLCIGKIFYAPIPDKPLYSTFEIPDFIIYKHSHHTNYTIDGIKINGGEQISDDIVCFSLKETKVMERSCYLETLAIHGNLTSGNLVSGNVYNHFLRNIIVNKDLLYAIMWYPKAACTTIGNIFCCVNNIKMNKSNEKNLSYYRPKYRFNPYLQGLNIISFTRNPYYRFLSTFIDKHIYQDDLMYLNLPGYKAFIEGFTPNLLNLSTFLQSKNYISDHYLPFHHFECCKYLVNKIKNTNEQEKKHILKFYKIEDGLNNILYTFLSQFHHEIDISILNSYENTILNKQYFTSNNSNEILSHDKFIIYNNDEWKLYLSNHALNYDIILTNELKKILFETYKEDFLLFGYSE